MALVGQPATLCHDGFVNDGVPPFSDAAFGYGYDDDYHYQPQLLEEECFLGGWELPTGVLGAEPGNTSAFDAGWTHAAGGVSSPASVLCFDQPTAASASHKRPRTHAQGAEQESAADSKKRCGGARKSVIKPDKTSGSTCPPKEPQSDAAKVRTLMDLSSQIVAMEMNSQ